jgi:copper(I)-binding protein
MSIPSVAALLALLVAAVAPLSAQDAPILVEKAWIRRAAPMPDSKPGAPSTAAGYAVLRNRGKTPDALVGATTDAAERVEVHETRNMSGMMMMEKVDKIALAPGAQVELKPGGYHLMLIGLKRALTPGQTVDVTFQFERAGRVAARAEVR